MAANAGTNVCLRRVGTRGSSSTPSATTRLPYCGAPIVHSMLANAPAEWRKGINHKVSGLVAAAPPAAVIEGMAKIGLDVTHRLWTHRNLRPPLAVCAKHEQWNGSARRTGGQEWPPEFRYHAQEAITVLDAETMEPVPWDNETMGEIMFRGNRDEGLPSIPKRHRGVLPRRLLSHRRPAVMQPDGYVKIKDRSRM